MLELVIVMILLGILAVTVLPRLPRSSDVAARAARDEVLAALRYAQQLAMSDATRAIRFVPTSNSYSITADGVNLSLPEGGGNYPRALPSDVSLSPTTTLTYDGLGNASATTFVLTASDSWQVCVEASGYAHAC
ncbi:type II secretion system protein [Permianibacter sp. IMCC34836]|uniref:type II secretion system protein n=1 Tax=Permianibacter fluminis TaxID=2738515 RepID=UPI001552C070|nr:type II secretion system protein [Permianibacter fluminis]NQD37292.1 type II secretion system protein [Permianibacter fluminis]